MPHLESFRDLEVPDLRFPQSLFPLLLAAAAPYCSRCRASLPIPHFSPSKSAIDTRLLLPIPAGNSIPARIAGNSLSIRVREPLRSVFRFLGFSVDSCSLDPGHGLVTGPRLLAVGGQRPLVGSPLQWISAGIRISAAVRVAPFRDIRTHIKDIIAAELAARGNPCYWELHRRKLCIREHERSWQKQERDPLWASMGQASRISCGNATK